MKILLVTPYTGANLGDAAIQEAVMHHLRKRIPRATFQLVTLSPAATAALHQVPSFPIASAEIVESGAPGTAASEPGMNPAGHPAGPRPANPGRTFRHRTFGRTARLGWNALRAPDRFARLAWREIRHSARAFRLVHESDAVVISGGGQIDDYWGGALGQPWSLFKWALLGRSTGKPVIFLSVGVCTLRNAGSQFLALRALRLATYRSYRDAGSKAMLRNFYFTKCDPVYPDLAFSHPNAVTGPGLFDQEPRANLTVGISPIAYLSSHGWPEQEVAIYGRYLEVLAGFVGKLLGDGHAVVVFTTAGQDRFAVADLMALVARKPGFPALGSRLTVARQVNLAAQLTTIERVDLVIASRLHGLIISNLLGKPTLAISYDRKVRVHMESIACERHCLDFRNLTSERLATAFAALAGSEPQSSVLLRARVENFARQLEHQYDEIAAMLPGKVAPPIRTTNATEPN